MPHPAPTAVPTLSGGGPLGHLRDLRERPLDLLARFNRECGDAGLVRLGLDDLLVVNTPELVVELLVEHHASLRKSRLLRAALYPLMGEGLFTSDGSLWRNQRRLMAPMFHPARVAEYARVMNECTSRCVARWRDGEVIDISREATRITMAIAGKTLFDIDTFDETDELGAALDAALRWSAEAAASLSVGLQVLVADRAERAAKHVPGALAGPLERFARALERPLTPPTAKNRGLAEAIATIDRRVERMIAERRAAPSAHDDLLSRLLRAHDDEDGGPAMSDRQLRDEVTTLFVAGHETTATALSWAFYLLAGDDAARARLEREGDGLGEDDPRELSRLPFATSVFKEALRLYPPVPVFERQAVEPFSIAGRELARGAYVAVFPWALHRRPELWPDPSRFDPERFAPEAERRRHRYAWVPFGAGPRVCIGNGFALLEGALALATIARRARLELVDRGPVVPDPAAATLRPLGGVRMRVRMRRPGDGRRMRDQ